MDRIRIEDLLVRCVLGLSPEERREKQDVLISVALTADLEKPGRSGRLPRGKEGCSRCRRELELPPGRGARAARGRSLSLTRRRATGSGQGRETRGASFCSHCFSGDRTRASVMPMRVFVGIGSNIEPRSNIKSALAALHRAVGVRAVSTFYRTPALKRPDDPPFANGVAELSDALAPLQLKRLFRRTEQALGRQRGPDPYAPRTIDL